MRKYSRGVAVLSAAALTATTVLGSVPYNVFAADTVKTVKLRPGASSPFNDTDGDGLGEFQGFGTSLCWWANRVGYSEALTEQATDYFYGDDGLRMNIGRYNIGGGDLVGTPEKVKENEAASFYDLVDENKPTFSGNSMKIQSYTKMDSVTYSKTDADFGLNSGDKVGTFTQIGWINALGAEVGDGGNLIYNVDSRESGKYTIKLLLALEGSNSRGMAIRVNGDKEYYVSADDVNSGLIANGNNNNLFVCTFKNVELDEGDNQIVIGGNDGWGLNFVKMAVIPSGKEGLITADQEFMHESHIKRSDSVVPGYCVDVTKITDEHDLEWYAEHFDQYDEECGYAWNYDWDADQNQVNVLKAAMRKAGDKFLAEAFSNSPPYFMTESGCSSGNVDANKDNLRKDSYHAFALYMADVIEHWKNEGVEFTSTDPMNEPYTNYWGANSNKQEGCHFDIGDSESKILNELNAELESRGIDIVLAASDETSIDTAIKAYNALDDDAKEAVDRIDTHTYSGSKRAALKELAESENKNLWMSEVDGTFRAGTNAGEMTDALGLVQRMMTDINDLDASAWILWNAIDMHADSENEYDYASLDELMSKVDESKGFWGIAFADHDNEKVELSKKYYGFGQVSRYIRPGDTILGSSDEGNILAAYDKENGKVKIVAMNTSDKAKKEKFDLSEFLTVGENVEAVRTSGSLESGENWSDVSDSADIKVDREAKTLTVELKANSITTYTIDGVSYDSSEEVIKSVENPTVYTVEGFDAKLPETVTVKTNKNNTKTAAVVWDTADKNLSKNGEVIEGTVEGSDIVAKATIKAAENNLAWYIDCNNAESTTYKEIDEYADLLNETPDQKYSEGSWGFVDDYGKYGPDNCDISDSYDIGYYAYKGQDIKYKVPMTAGDYKLTFGFKEWWWVNRPMKITAEVNGETKTLGTTNSLNGNKNWNTAGYEFTLDEDAEVTFTVAKNGSSDPVLSFIKIQKLLDTESLKAAIISADSIDEAAYPARRVKDVKKAAESGRELLVKAAATQEDIDSAEQAIEDAIANLNTKITKKDIEDNDNVLYLVNAGAADVSVVPENYVLGVCQSNTDQEYGEDEATGMKWGIEPNDEYSEAVSGGSGDGLTDTYIYMSPDITFKKGVSGFKYRFEIPDTGITNYNVTVGFKNPWSARNVNVTLEGETAERSLILPQGTTVEETYNIEVKDGELNVMVHNPNRTSQYVDPVLSYIIVKAGKKSEEEKEIVTYSSITGTAGERLFDTSGNKVQAHGGQISKFTVNGETKYYWYGEDKTYGTDPVTGVHLYTSDDLYNWDDQGVVLRTIVPDDSEYGSYASKDADLSVFTENEYFKDLYGDYEGQAPDDAQYDSKLEETYWNLAGDRCIIERPKVIYNEKTKKYVMWFHADGMMKSNRTASSKYSKARAGIAVSDTPAGPFKLVGCYKLATSENADLGWDTVGGSVRDMNLFVDDDGQAYVVYSSDGNSTMYVAKLNEEYTGIAGNEEGVDFTRNFIGASREAPAPFKYKGKYYIITSGCTGWAPNKASYAVADSMLGPWTTMGNPCVDDTTNTTFDTQSTYVIPYDAENGKYIYVGDRWFNPDEGKDLSDSRYVLLPIEFGSGNTISLKKYENWTLDELENKGSFEVDTAELPKAVEYAADLDGALPSEINVDYGKGKVSEAVSWETEADENAFGEVEVTGKLSESGRTFTYKVSVVDPDTIYFFDSGAETSEYFDAVKSNVKALRNSLPDQKYTDESKAGYEGVLKSENSSSFDLGHHDGDDYLSNGWWAAGNKDIVYSFDLEEGEYTVTEGFQEWWNTARPCRMTIKAGDDILAEKSFNVEKTSTNLQISQKFTVDAEHAGKVTVRVAKTGSADPVISFVGVRKAGAGDENVYTLKNAWGKTYCIDQNGERVTGFAVVDGAARYFDPAKKGIMKSAAFFDAEGNDGEEHTFYANKDGSLVKGFKSTWTGKYYFDENGYMLKNGFTDIDGATYYFEEDGKMHTGWLEIGDDTYRFDKDGKMFTGTVSSWGRTYTFDNDGKLVK